MRDQPFHYVRGGIHFPALGLWLDAPTARAPGERVFVSHAHSDHTAAHAEVILTHATARLLQARLGGKRSEHVLTFGEPREFDGLSGRYQITLLPAGHILGSAMSLIEWDGRSLLYTGDFKLAPGLAAEPCDPRPGRGCEFLIMETTFGRPHYVFPPAPEVLAAVVRFCRETLADGGVPILLGWSLGKSQEILAGLAGTDLPVMLHPAVRRLTAVYESLGYRFPPHRDYVAAAAAGHVVIGPPTLAGPELRATVGRVRVAALTGWACDASCRFQYRADIAFPLSDHADHRDLLELVRLVEPQEVLTLHGFAADFAATLRGRGVSARALSEPEQLGWSFGTSPILAPEPRIGKPGSQPPFPHAPKVTGKGSSPGSFRAFATACNELQATTNRGARIRCLTEYFRPLSPDELALVADWLAGPGETPRPGRTFTAAVPAWHPVVSLVTGVSAPAFRQLHLKHGDLAGMMVELLAGQTTGGIEIATVDACLRTAGGSNAQPDPAGWAALMRQCDPEEARWLIRLALGELRLGRLWELLPETLAALFPVEARLTRRALQISGQSGAVARAATAGTLDAFTVRPGQPLPLMSPLHITSVVEVTERTAGSRVWLGESFEGRRCQLHRGTDGSTAWFTAEGEPVTELVPTLYSMARRLPGSMILDGTIVGRLGGVPRPPAEWPAMDTTGDLFSPAGIVYEFVAEDLLWRDGIDEWERPWESRRAQMERCLTGIPGLRLAPGAVAVSAAALAAGVEAIHAAGGIATVRLPEEAYTPGESTQAWMRIAAARPIVRPRRRRR